jgi:hypothetical protein
MVRMGARIGVEGDDAVAVVDDTLAGDVRFVVVADSASSRATAEVIGDAVRTNLASEPDDIEPVIS